MSKLTAALMIVGISALFFVGEAFSQEVRYCYDRSSYPTKVVIVCGGCQCPAGYY